MIRIYMIGILGIYVLCSGLLFSSSEAYAQSFVLQPKSSKSNNNYNYKRNTIKPKAPYTGGVLIPRKNKNTKNTYNRNSQLKPGIYNGVYKSESTLKKEAEAKEKDRIKKRQAKNKVIIEKMRLRNEKKMAAYYEEQKKKEEEAKRTKLRGGKVYRPPANVFYKNQASKKTR